MREVWVCVWVLQISNRIFHFKKDYGKILAHCGVSGGQYKRNITIDNVLTCVNHHAYAYHKMMQNHSWYASVSTFFYLHPTSAQLHQKRVTHSRATQKRSYTKTIYLPNINWMKINSQLSQQHTKHIQFRAVVLKHCQFLLSVHCLRTWFLWDSCRSRKKKLQI